MMPQPILVARGPPANHGFGDSHLSLLFARLVDEDEVKIDAVVHSRLSPGLVQIPADEVFHAAGDHGKPN